MEKKTKSIIVFLSVIVGSVLLVTAGAFIFMAVIINNSNNQAVKSVISQKPSTSREWTTSATTPTEIDIVASEDTETADDSKRVDDEEDSQDTPVEETYPILFEDKYVKISYVGFGKGASYPFENRQCLILMVENKTDTVFDFLPRSISLDGIDVGKLSCYESVSAHSKGKIYLLKMKDTDNEFENTTPSRITGAIAIKDSLDIGIWGKDEWWYIVSFVDVDL